MAEIKMLTERIGVISAQRGRACNVCGRNQPKGKHLIVIQGLRYIFQMCVACAVQTSSEVQMVIRVGELNLEERSGQAE